MGVLQPEVTYIWVNETEDKITIDFSKNRIMKKSIIFISML